MDKQKSLNKVLNKHLIWTLAPLAFLFTLFLLPEETNFFLSVGWLIVLLLLFVNVFWQAKRCDNVIAGDPKLKKKWEQRMQRAFPANITYWIVIAVIVILIITMNRLLFNYFKTIWHMSIIYVIELIILWQAHRILLRKLVLQKKL